MGKKIGDKIEVKTPLGTLVAYPSTDKAHPGIFIDLKRGGKAADLSLACIECKTWEKDLDKRHSLSAYVWGDALYEDPTYGTEYSDIEGYFKGEPYHGAPDAKDRG